MSDSCPSSSLCLAGGWDVQLQEILARNRVLDWELTRLEKGIVNGNFLFSRPNPIERSGA